MTPLAVLALITEFASAARAAGELVQQYTGGLDQIAAQIEQHNREGREWLPEEIAALRAQLNATRAGTLRKIEAAERAQVASNPLPKRS